MPAASVFYNSAPASYNLRVSQIVNNTNLFLTPTLDCPVPAPPQPRDVHPIAVEFHNLAAYLGLPMPLINLPYVENPNGVQPSIPLEDMGIQGFGPSSYSYQVSLNLTAVPPVLAPDGGYGNSYQIHNGIDYAAIGVSWDDRVIVSICDGVVIPGNYYVSGVNTGGSAKPGRGVSVRCFMDRLDSGRADTDGDGLPNLSNIIVTYNHLLGDVNPTLSNYINCALLSPFVCEGTDLSEGQYLLAKFRPEGQPALVVRDCQEFCVNDFVPLKNLNRKTSRKANRKLV
jgi:hypothetical protein